MESVFTSAIQQALLAFERNNPASWCAPLVDALESRCEGSAIEWCVDVVIHTVAIDATSDDARTLAELKHLVDRKSSATELHERSRDIWYSKHPRGDLQTATSKAYEAVAAFANGDVQRYRRGIAFIVSGVALRGTNSLADERLPKVIEAFKCRCEKCDLNGSCELDRQ